MHNNNNGYPSNLAAWTTVAILMVAYVLSFIDRQILNLLVGPIRRDLAISDTEMSLLMGLSFALFYTLCGIPLGRMADNRSRRGLILFGVLVWSAMTAACGLARSYWQFLTFRVGVGVGEAALSPAAYSLIADSFPRERRATAISVYSMGIYLGSGLAFLLGGLVIKFASAQGDVHLPLFGEVRPWQLIFLILGAAGVLFCLLLLPAGHRPDAALLGVLEGRPWARCQLHSTQLELLDMHDTPSLADGEDLHELDQLPIPVSFEVGRRTLDLHTLSTLQPGSLLDLDSALDGEVRILANQRCLGIGELVRLQDRLGVRVTRLFGHDEA